MYICICNAITKSELRQAARCCRGDAEAIYTERGTPPQCGQCLEEADEIIEQVRTAAKAPVLVSQ